jgi:hypothetical protein
MKSTTAILLGFALSSPIAALAQELTPRAYWPAPKGTQIVQIGFAYTSGDTLPDPSLPIIGFDSSISSYYLAYLHTLDLWGRTANLIMEFPFVDGQSSAEHDSSYEIDRRYQGLGDIDFTLSMNIFGAPSMTREEFADLRRNPQPILGASLKVKAPTGHYNSDRVVNVGANRWSVRPQLGYIQPLHSKWLLELAAGVWFFGDNDNFLGFKREQDPILALESHLVHRFGSGFWVSLDLNYYQGGRSRLDGEKLNDVQRDSKAGFTVVYPFARRHAMKFGYSRGSLNDSDETFDYFLVSYQRLL